MPIRCRRLVSIAALFAAGCPSPSDADQAPPADAVESSPSEVTRAAVPKAVDKSAAVEAVAAPTPTGRGAKSLANTRPKPGDSGTPDRPTARTQVIRVSGKTCPGFKADQPWSLVSPPAVAGQMRPAWLSRFCVYQANDGVPVTADLTVADFDAPAASILNVAPDYAELVPQGPAAVGQVAEVAQEDDQTDPPSLLEIFHQQQGIEFTTGAAAALDAAEASRPFVAIIDTADFGTARVLGGASRLEHGLAMAGIVDALRCIPGDKGCADRLFFEQAFPDQSFGVAAHESKGSVWSLTEAVVSGVLRWKAQTAALGQPAPPLVVNMSVGWEWTPAKATQLAALYGPKQGPLESGPSVPTPAEEALYLALGWASCEGALSIAASGNTRMGACDGEGPLAPGAWEALPAPTAEQCKTFFGLQAPGNPDGSLVYAAGGVDLGNRPIVNARANSTPPRVLYSSLTPSAIGTGQSTPWTGTSVATASLSAIAAQVWMLSPSLTAHEVMQKIDQQAEVVDASWQASVYGSSTAPTVKRVRANNLSDLAGIYGSRPAPRSYPRGRFTSGFVNPQIGSPVAMTSTTVAPSSCAGRTVTSYSIAGATEPQTNPWPELRPQPERAICPSCPLTVTNTGAGNAANLRVAISNQHTVTVPTAILELHTQFGNQPRQVSVLQVPIPSQCMSGGQLQQSVCSIDLAPFTVNGSSLPNFLMNTTVHQASLFFYAQGGAGPQRTGHEIRVVK